MKITLELQIKKKKMTEASASVCLILATASMHIVSISSRRNCIVVATCYLKFKDDGKIILIYSGPKTKRPLVTIRTDLWQPLQLIRLKL